MSHALATVRHRAALVTVACHGVARSAEPEAGRAKPDLSRRSPKGEAGWSENPKSEIRNLKFNASTPPNMTTRYPPNG